MIFDGAKWIGAALRGDAGARTEGKAHPAVCFRCGFKVGKGLVKAVLYATAAGLYEAYVNDFFAGDGLFAPGFSNCEKRVLYQEYDVTEKLHKGKNVFGALVVEGPCGGEPRLLMKLVLTYRDGSVCGIASNGSFKTSGCRILSSRPGEGETVDGRLPENYEMFLPGMDVREWDDAVEYGEDFSLLAPEKGEPVRYLHRLKATPLGGGIYDFGQNAVGAPYLSVRADEGTKLTLRFADALKDGALCFTDGCPEKDCDVFYCKRGSQILSTAFACHRCRYAELRVEGGEAKIADFFFNVCHSDLARTGMFDCSSERINKIYADALWSQRSRFVYLPSASPRAAFGKGGAALSQLLCEGEMYNADCRRFYADFLENLRLGQREDGAVPDLVPDAGGTAGRAVSGNAVCVIPDAHYLMYGDPAVLKDNIDAMKSWVAYQKAHSQNLIRPAESGEDADGTDGSVVATACFAQSALLTAKCLDILGLESAEYYALYEDIRTAFISAFADSFGRIRSDTQSCYLLELAYGLSADGDESFRHLLRTLERSGGVPQTGALGAALLLPVLCEYGRGDLAYGILLSSPPHGFFGAPESCLKFLYSQLLGIRPDEAGPGFKKLVISPVTDPEHRVTEASGCYECGSGRVDVEWTDEDGVVTLKVCKPAGMKTGFDIRGDILSAEANGEAATLSLLSGAEEICVKYRPGHGGVKI